VSPSDCSIARKSSSEECARRTSNAPLHSLVRYPYAMVSPFFKLSANTLLGAYLISILSLYCHAGLWRGVAVAGAGDASVDGYYYWIGQKGAITYAQNVHSKIGIRLPDVYSLSWLQPQMQLEEPGRSHILQKGRYVHSEFELLES
jgi:hypothetical protein